MKVKILYESETKTLEDMVNQWLDTHQGFLVDIKFAMYGTDNSSPCAMIIYE